MRSFVKRLVAILLIMVVVVAAVLLWGARPGPVFTLSGMSAERSCFFNTTQGNTSSWDVFVNITNHGSSASAAVTIAVDGSAVASQYDFIPSGATVEVHQIVTDSSIPVDAACLPHDVTVGIGGYVA